MARALNRLRQGLHYRRDAFDRGLAAAGLRVVSALPDPRPGDVLLVWNRYGGNHEEAMRVEHRGGTVLVVENGCLGKGWRGGDWFSLARGAVAMTGGDFRPAGPERWDAIGEALQPWHAPGGETVILAQRGIGAPTVRSPDHWAEAVRGRYGGRIRQHPGAGEVAPIDADLARASEVITWSSAAALQALALGVPVWHAHPLFVGGPAARPLMQHGHVEARRDDSARLDAFRRLAWAMWTLDEISTGAPIARLLGR